MLRSFLSFCWQIIKTALIALIIVIPIRYFVFQPFIVKGISMEPSFRNGDYLIIDELSYRLRSPKRGEVVVFRYPADTREKFIKRIIGLPNETIEFKNGKIVITSSLGEKTILDESVYLPAKQTWAGEKIKKVKIPSDSYFVMGDNRLHSFDSRSWGFVSKKYLIGRVLLRLFPFKDICFFSPPMYSLDAAY